MGMLRRGACALVAVVCLGSVAQADDGDWRLGAEVGLTSSGTTLGGLGGLGPTTSGTSGLEYRVSERWWLLARVNGSVHSQDGLDLWELGAGLGGRLVLNPNDLVRVSLTGVLDTFHGEGTINDNDVWYQGGGVTLGMAVDLALVDALDLRLALPLLRLTVTDTTSSTAFAIAFDMAPTVGLAVTF